MELQGSWEYLGSLLRLHACAWAGAFNLVRDWTGHDRALSSSIQSSSAVLLDHIWSVKVLFMMQVQMNYTHTYIYILLTYTCRIWLALIEWWCVVSGLFGWHWPGRFRSSKHPRIYWIILGPISSWLEFDILNTTLGAVPAELWKMWMMNGSRSRDAQ